MTISNRAIKSSSYLYVYLYLLAGFNVFTLRNKSAPTFDNSGSGSQLLMIMAPAPTVR